MAATIVGFAAELPPDQIEFFEARVRPILVEHCYKCHSVESGKSKGGLELDTREAMRRGGASGAVLVAGDPDQSLLIEAVRYASEDLQMPPADEGGKLSPDKIAVLESWVRQGAPDPRTGGRPDPLDLAAARRHWAFQPVVKPAVPAADGGDGAPGNPIDAFVRAKQREMQLAFAPAADARTLLRRLTYDLTGLPPTPEETEAFERDYGRDSGAYERVVERLLSSPAYGERWGRFWLDVARYADTQGYLVGNAERRFAFSHTYRDYVIRAFNEDKPFDRFLVEQLAADRLPLGDDKSPLAALGFLTLGRRFLNNQNDIIDDRIDVVTRGLLGLTVTCARCHDHKYDPVSMHDYYALHGVFASSEEPAEKPLLQPLAETPAYHEFLRKRAALEEKIKDREREEVEKFISGARARTGDYLLGVHDFARLPPDAKLDLFVGPRKLNAEVLKRWQTWLAGPAKTDETVLAPWFVLAALPEAEFSERAAAVMAEWKEKTAGEAAAPTGAADAVVAALAEAEKHVAALKDVAAAYNRVFAAAEKPAKGAETLSPGAEAIRTLGRREDFPANLGYGETAKMLKRQIDTKTAPLKREIEALNWTEPGAPVRAMALADRATPRNSPVLLRGNPANKGPEVPRRFLSVLAGDAPAPFQDGSGRLELAQAIATAENPLTARVWVNRVWGWHFGTALVRTPSDFGVRTEAPEQRELLDWLAAHFVASGWSVKALHRVIVRSQTYRQSSDAPAASLAADPENRFLTRFQRRRLEFEAMRDTLLAVAGRLDQRIGGHAEDLGKTPFTRRRTVYGFIDRQNLPGMFRTFDFPNPDVSSAQRFATTVPQQALFLLNSPFVLEQARALGERVERAGGAGEAERIEVLHRLVFQRAPDEAERAAAREFLERPVEAVEPEVGGEVAPLDSAGPAGKELKPVTAKPPEPLSRLAALAQVLLLSNEAAFVD